MKGGDLNLNLIVVLFALYNKHLLQQPKRETLTLPQCNKLFSSHWSCMIKNGLKTCVISCSELELPQSIKLATDAVHTERKARVLYVCMCTVSRSTQICSGFCALRLVSYLTQIMQQPRVNYSYGIYVHTYNNMRISTREIFFLG